MLPPTNLDSDLYAGKYLLPEVEISSTHVYVIIKSIIQWNAAIFFKV